MLRRLEYQNELYLEGQPRTTRPKLLIIDQTLRVGWLKGNVQFTTDDAILQWQV